MQVRCRDFGTPSRSATGTVQISYLTTTTTSTTTTTTTTTQAPKTSIWDDDAFVAVFAILMVILGLALLAALWYFCCRGQNAQCMDFGPR